MKLRIIKKKMWFKILLKWTNALIIYVEINLYINYIMYYKFPSKNFKNFFIKIKIFILLNQSFL